MEQLFWIFLLCSIAVVYFIPAIVARGREHENAGGITALNLLLGWTLLGWIGALVWSLSGKPKPAAGTVKTCPHCKSTIPADAQKCRHCAEWVQTESPPATDAGPVKL